jgi:hypothetical protein
MRGTTSATAGPTPAERARGILSSGYSHSILVGVSLLGFLPGCFLLPAESAEHKVRGPLPSRTQQPLALTFLALKPRSANTQQAGSVGVALESVYSSIYEFNQLPGQRAAFDGEILRADLRLRFGLAADDDIEIELGGLYATSGFLDGFIDSFHDSLAIFADGGRDLAAPDQYEMRVRRAGQTVYELEEDRAGFTDLPIIYTHRLRHEDDSGPAIAWRLGVELPTGSDGRGFGNGGVDYGSGVLLERSSARWTITGALDVVVNAEPAAFAGSSLNAPLVFQVQNGYEYRWSSRLSLLGQLFYTSPFVDGIELEEIDRDVLDLGLGCAWDWGDETVVTFSFHEDVIAATGPDFSLYLGVATGF